MKELPRLAALMLHDEAGEDCNEERSTEDRNA